MMTPTKKIILFAASFVTVALAIVGWKYVYDAFFYKSNEEFLLNYELYAHGEINDWVLETHLIDGILILNKERLRCTSPNQFRKINRYIELSQYSIVIGPKMENREAIIVRFNPDSSSSRHRVDYTKCSGEESSYTSHESFGLPFKAIEDLS